MKKIKLTQGKWTLVSDEDYEYLNQWKWYALKGHKTFYAVKNSPRVNGKHTLILRHRVIAERMGIKNPDHADCNGLNNQRNNLRAATVNQQQINRSLQSNNTSGYKGVYWSKNVKKWRGQIWVNYKRVHLGYFDNIKDATRAYNKAALKYFGEFAVLNKV